MKTKPRVTLVNLAQLDWIRRSGRVGVSESDKRETKKELIENTCIRRIVETNQTKARRKQK
jgi:hypothetical protein